MQVILVPGNCPLPQVYVQSSVTESEGFYLTKVMSYSALH